MAINITPGRVVSVGNGLKIGKKDLPTTSSTTEKKNKQLYSTLDDLKDSYLNEAMGSTKDTDALNYSTLTDEDLKKVASKMYSDYYNDKRKNSDKTYKEKELDYSSKIASEGSKLGDKKKQAQELLNEEKSNLMNSAIEKGIQRSSIVGKKIKSFDDVFESTISMLGDAYKKKAEELKNAIDKLDEKKESAEQKIDQDEKEAIDKKVESLKKLADNKNFDKEAYEKYRLNVLKEVYGFLKNFSQKDAIEVLKSDKKIQEALGEDYALMLNYLYGRRG